MSVGTPRRMKMTCRCPAIQKKDRLLLQRAGSEVVFYLVPRACRGVGPGYPKAPHTVASFRLEAEHATETLSKWISHQPAAYEGCIMDVVFPHCAGLDVHKNRITACRVSPDPTGQNADGVMEVRDFGTLPIEL